MANASRPIVRTVDLLESTSARAQDPGIPAGTSAKGADTTNSDAPPDVILVAADDCTVSPGASTTLADGDGTQGTFTDGERGITITAPNGSPRIEGPPGDFVGNHASFPTSDKSFDTDGDYRVVSSRGIICRRGGATPEGTTPAQDQYQGSTTPKQPPAPVDDSKGTIPGTGVGKMPDTGGPPLTVGVLVLSVAAIIAGVGVLRR